MANVIDIVIPDLGEFSEVEVIEILVKAGGRVAREDGLITLETDKAVMDVPAPDNGVIEEMSVAVGDTVSSGDVIGRIAIEVSDTAVVTPAIEAGHLQGDTTVAAPPPVQAPAAPAAASAPKPAPALPKSLPAIDEAGFSNAHASPSVRKLARELGVDLVQVKGSGQKKRILHDDVKAFVKAILTAGAAPAAGAALPQVPVVDFAKFGEIETKPLTRIQKISGPRLQASWINLPHVTQHDLADITELEARRQELKGPAKEKGIGLTPLAFIMKACIVTLKEYPKANASLSEDGESLVFKKYFHLGFAADTENGLMVPVIRDADRMDVYELAQALAELSAAARQGKLKAQQLQGASFTISSLGGIGGTAFTPIVNAPEVAILGVSRSTMQPVWNGSKFEPRLMLPISLSYDHRVIDGAMAAQYLLSMRQYIENPATLLV
ncbi:MAG: 2-oxo acid dehydrogenase subunit E2 [Proteobacteria bacterium]|nr:2-oxo acid dehydrogenase subunit E2 [Pseudomonadota bacterium]